MDIIQTTISASVLVLAIIVIRALALHRLPKATFPVLWCAAAIRSLIPVQIPCRLSIYSLIWPLLSNQAAAAVPDISPASPAAELRVMAAADATVFHAARPVSVWTVIWLAGASIVTVLFAASYIHSLRRFQRSQPVQNDTIARLIRSHAIRRPVQVRSSDSVAAPLTYGIFRPTILLPETADWSDTEQLTYIVTHECVHIRRFDGLGKLLLTAAVCVHWFNPLAWAMMLLANRDIEMSCDEAVVRALGDAVKSAYALALIGMEERKRVLSPIINNFSKNAIEERIIAIMKIKHTSVLSIILALAVVLGTVTVFATSASAADAEQAEIVTAVEDDAVMTEIAIARLAENHPKVAQWLQKIYPDTVWWTYEDYKAVSEQYLQGLKDNLGQMIGYDRNGNSLVITEEWREEETKYAEDTLQKLRDGIMISKSIDGNEELCTQIDPGEVESWPTQAYECTIDLLDGTEKHFGPYDTMEELREQVEPFCREQLAAGNLSQEDMDEITAFMAAAD